MIQGRTADTAHGGILALLPPGRAWSRDPRSDFARIFAGAARAIADLEERVASLAEEIDPRTANRFLSGFERVLGADPCGLDDDGSIGLRRAAAHRRWTRKGGQSPAYFVALAASYGIDITIETYRPVVCGDELGAAPLITSPEQFVWTVRLAAMWERPPILGDQVCGDFLGEIGLSPVECLIRRYAPAHTIVVFDYSES